MLLYALTVFCSAFLLFSVQPLIGKFLLPWFGGAPAVWTTCILFFQGLLLVGYAYAHFLSNRCRSRYQRSFHLGLLALSIVLLVGRQAIWNSPLLPDAHWKPEDSSHPVWRVMLFLTVSVGGPFFILSSTAPLVQRWFSRSFAGRSPYRLYALSNLGSLLALIGYPLLIEPFLPLRAQAFWWTAGYLVFVLTCGACAVQMSRSPDPSEPPSQAEGTRTGVVVASSAPGSADYALWLGLSAGPSVLLLAITNQLCQEVAVVPFLWVLPLAIYLLSFIVCFESDRIYRRSIFLAALAVALVLACFILFRGVKIRIPGQVLSYSFILASCCMVCHGELSRLKPDPSRLTAFYLMIALGGAMGGGFVGLLAPLIFSGFWELHWGLWFCGLLVCIALLKDRTSWIYRGHPGPACLLPVILLAMAGYYWQEDIQDRLIESGLMTMLPSWGLLCLLGLGSGIIMWCFWWFIAHLKRPQGVIVSMTLSLALLGVLLHSRVRAYLEDSVWTARSFYGVLVVLDEDRENALDHHLRLRHGRITHGLQFQDPAKRHLPTTYYGLTSGVGLALQLHPGRSSMINGSSPARALRIGVVGLGVGTIAAYARPGDTLRFYEINPDVIRISLSSPLYFHYLKESRGQVEVIAGDARLAMERELAQGNPQDFDLLAIDAFSSDSIPAHLLTEEAVQVYLKHLHKPDGVLAFHVTNRYLDLKPVVWQLAGHFGLQSRFVSSESVGDLAWESYWMLLAWNNTLLGLPEIVKASTPQESNTRHLRLWTDDYSNLFQVLKW